MKTINIGYQLGGPAWSDYPDGIENDSVGLETVRNLSKRVAEVVLKIHG